MSDYGACEIISYIASIIRNVKILHSMNFPPQNITLNSVFVKVGDLVQDEDKRPVRTTSYLFLFFYIIYFVLSIKG